MGKVEAAVACRPSTSGINKTAKLPRQHSIKKILHQRPTECQKILVKESINFDTSAILSKEPQRLSNFLFENRTEFNEYLTSTLPSNAFVQTLYIMKKICMMTTTKETYTIMHQTQQNWMKQLDMYLVKLSLEDEEDEQAKNAAFWENPEAFWNSLLLIFETIFEKFRNNLTQLFSRVVKSCLITIDFLQASEIKVANLQVTRKLELLNETLNKLSEKGKIHECMDNYKTIRVYPEPNEIAVNKRSFIRQNIIEGGYKSVEYYLDTHFRLLREDFLGPLRQAICLYRTNTNEKISEFHVYPRATFIRNSYNIGDKRQAFQKQTYTVLSPGGAKNKFAHPEDDFMNGNLLCFSSDNFHTTFFGLVKINEHSLIYVDLFENPPDGLYDQTYTMLASTNYFNPYYWVLKALQTYSTIDFPMEKYIINVVNKQETPDYLNPSTTFTINGCTFRILDYNSWPQKETLQLNEMQYEAFKHALTSKFAIIQGPPGTGKTHLGLKIAQSLIENRDAWGVTSFRPVMPLSRLMGANKTKVVHTQPILVVAYTNHALDQFLEGVLPYTNKIIRLGGGSKSDLINRLKFKPDYRDFNDFEILNNIKSLLKNNKAMVDEIESLYKGIFNLNKIASVLPQLFSNWFINCKSIVVWLMGKRDINVKERRRRWDMVKIVFGDLNFNKNVKFSSNAQDSANYVLTIYDLQKDAKILEKYLANRNSVDLDTIFEDWDIIEEELKQIKDHIWYLHWRLQHAEDHHKLYTATKFVNNQDLNGLPYNERWILYYHWLKCYREYLQNIVNANNIKIKQMWEELDQQKQKHNSKAISKATIVGMTTSGAAKNRHLLENLKCRIVIIEEAAEVLESHIITSLTPHCQHLILIGDHQQLRPSTNDYEIEKDYYLGISLFERMVRNGVCYKTLQIQHRMRPEISRLIVPAIYSNLQDHPSTCNFPNINGIVHNVFFITHKHPEASLGKTKRNIHEANYVIALARHLILQNIEASHITILTTYKGQMHEIREKQNENKFNEIKKIRVSVVDDFQGEENQIILLSLVRSNNYNNAGFLAIENRVCVALSRAKRGFYIIGNMDTLSRGSTIWPKIKEVLERNKQIGPGLELACQLHPLNITIVRNPEDFLRVPEGGCYETCNAELKCGHSCRKKCHVTDQNHADYYCQEPCTRNICPETHPCPMKCYQKCEPCKVPMARTLPCGHVKVLPCHVSVEDYNCKIMMKSLLKCGHSTQKLCHVDKNTVLCNVRVKTVLPKCGHKINKPCYKDDETILCPVEVETTLPECNHMFMKPCHLPIEKASCEVTISIKSKCGHNVDVPCYQKHRFLVECKHKCLKQLNCGHICQEKCHHSVDKAHLRENQCMQKCKKFKNGCKTAHKCSLPCSAKCEPCNETARKTLPCGHSILVSCKDYNKKFLCKSRCSKIKPCGHICFSQCHPICDYSICSFKVYKKFAGCNHGMKINCKSNTNVYQCRKCRSGRMFTQIKREE